MKNLPRILITITAVAAFGLNTHAADANLTWTGGTNTTWTTGSNWTGGSAPASDLTTNGALFNSASYAHQPNVGTTSIGSIEIGASNTGTSLNIAGTTLTLGNAGAGTGGTGILVDSGSGVATISVGTIKLGQATNNWKNQSAHLLTISSAISSNVAGTNTLSIASTAGAGGITLSGVISDGTGTTAVLIGTSGGLSVTTLSGANTFTGGLSIVDNSGSSVSFSGNLSATSGAVTATALGEGTVTLGLGTSSLNYVSGSGGFINNAITVANGGNITLGNTSGHTVNYSGGITGTVLSTDSLTISGSSSTIFSGANTYAGPTAVSGNLTLAGSNTGGGNFSVTGTMSLTGTMTGSNISTSGSGTFTESSSGVIAGAGATFTQGSTGTSTLAGANTYGGATTVNAGTLLVNNTSGSATGSGTFALSAGAALSGTGAINSSTFALGASGTPATVVVGNGTDTTSGLTLTGSSVAGANTITNTQLTFNLSVTTAGQANVLSVGSSGIAFSGTTLELNMVGVGVVAAYTPYELIAGTSNSQYSGFTTFINGLGQTEILAGTGLDFNFEGGPSTSWYQTNSYLIVSGGDIDVVVVPEPGTWALMMGGLVALVFIQRRKRAGTQNSDCRR